MQRSALFLLIWAVTVVTAQNIYSNATDGNGNLLPNYSPGRPPAVPLAVKSPYTSAWQSTAGNSTLNSGWPVFWPGNTLGWDGIVAVDGVSYEYLGAGRQTLPTMPNMFKSATPEDVSYDSQYSNYTFLAGPVRITASFFSPVTPKDICRSSIPLSYLTTSVSSLDGQAHEISFYSDINGNWISEETNKTLQWNLTQGGQTTPKNTTIQPAETGSTLYSFLYSLAKPYTFGEIYDFPTWGNFSYTSAPQNANNFSFQAGWSIDVRFGFVNNNNSLTNVVDPNFRPAGTQEPVFAFAHDFGRVSNASVMYTIGSIQTPIMRYLHSAGVSALSPWWEHCYGSMSDMISFHWNDFTNVATLGADFEAQLESDIDSYYQDNMAMVYSNSTPSPPPPYAYVWPNGSTQDTSGTDQYGEQYIFNADNAYGWLDASNFSGIGVPDVAEPEAYYAIVALSARQVMGAYVYAIPPAGGSCGSNSSDVMMFQKEISSDGNVNTVDVLYPATPFFLWANPEMIRYTLQGLFENQEGDFYPNGYASHDLGTNFPNATGHVEGNDEYMPVEESGNMILMSYAYYKFSGNSAWLSSHYALLKQYAQYLIQFSLLPEAQLSTDDFAGTLVNQTNLAMKGIVGLQAMSSVASIAGQTADAANFSATAQDYYSKWKEYAIDPAGKHTLLAYQWRSSWGLLYNTYFDKLLNLGLVDDAVYSMQSDWYPTVSQIFGVPLDNRHHYTKSDWEIWTAATCTPETRRLFVNGLAYWLNETTTEYPFTDLYETTDGYYPTVPNTVNFIARPVVGGHFALLAMERSGQLANGGNSVFGVGSTGAVSTEIELPTQASASSK